MHIYSDIDLVSVVYITESVLSIKCESAHVAQTSSGMSQIVSHFFNNNCYAVNEMNSISFCLISSHVQLCLISSHVQPKINFENRNEQQNK